MIRYSLILAAMASLFPFLAQAEQRYRMEDVAPGPQGGYQEYGDTIYIDRASVQRLNAMSPRQRDKTFQQWSAGRAVIPQGVPTTTQASQQPYEHPDAYRHRQEEQKRAAEEAERQRYVRRGDGRVYSTSSEQPRLRDYPGAVANVSAFDATRVNRSLLKVKDPDRYVRMNAFDRTLQGNVHARMDNRNVDSTIRAFDRRDGSISPGYSRERVNAGRQNEFSDLVEVPNVDIDKRRLYNQEGIDLTKKHYIRSGIPVEKKVSTKAFDVPITTTGTRRINRAFAGARSIEAFPDQITPDRTPRAMLNNNIHYQHVNKDKDYRLERYDNVSPNDYRPSVSAAIGVEKMDHVQRMQVIPVRTAPRLLDENGNPIAEGQPVITYGAGHVYPQDETASQLIYSAPNLPIFSGPQR